MEKEKQQILMKNNKIIKAKYDLNLIENKAFQLILFNFQKNSNDTLVAEISRKDFEQILKKDVYKTKKGIDEVLTKLYQAEIYFKDDEGEGKARFINSYKYIESDSKVRIKADSEIYKLIFNYLKGYTPVNLPIFFSFKSYYTQRVYELLRVWSNVKNNINYKVDELRELLMLKDKYNLYKDFKRRVIAPAVKELNEKSLMQVEFKENKTGRKVTSIDFIVTDNDKRKYFDTPTTVINKSMSSIPVNVVGTNKNKFKGFKSIIENYTNNEELRNTIVEFIQVRKANKAMLTDNSLEKLLNELDKIANNDLDKIEILNKSILKGYRGIFPIVNNDYNNQYKPSNKTLRFTDYEQRTYDYDDLERRLLGWDTEN